MATNDFVSGLISQGSGSSSASFPTGSAGRADPALQGVSRSNSGATVNTGRHRAVVDTELLALNPATATHEDVTDSATLDQAALSLFGMSKGPNGQVAALQRALYDAGYLSKINTPGIPDDDTSKAYNSLLQQVAASNQAGDPITVDQYLQQSQAAGAQARAEKAAAKAASPAAIPNGRVVSTTSATDIASTMQQIAQQELGRKLNPKQLQAFITVYHGIESQKNQQAVSAGVAAQTGQNSTIENAPNVSDAADSYVQQNFGAEYGAKNVADTFDAFRKLVS